jgi:seryl-tRNA synthetase
MPDASTPDGADEHANVVVKVWGEKPSHDFTPKDHADLGVALGILDFERAAKISGARFTVLLGAAARLERALLSFMMDVHANEHGYTEIWPPALVLPSAMRGTGQLPKFAADMFKTERTKLDETATDEERAANDLYLAPTAEVPVTNFHGDEIFEAPTYRARTSPTRRASAPRPAATARTPRASSASTSSTRSSSCASAGPVKVPRSSTRFAVTRRRSSRSWACTTATVQLCAGDMGFGAKKCFDLEVWLPGQNAYREISSCSWFGDFQARRAKIRYRDEPKGKPQLAHTLNGSGLAIGRTLVAILEQYQDADGSVRVPEALRPYMGGLERITKKG